MEEKVTPQSQHNAFKFWSRKDKESKDVPLDAKQGALSKEFIWSFVLNNNPPYDEEQCVEQLKDVRKVWAIVSETKPTSPRKSHMRKQSTFGKDVEKMVRDNYIYISEERSRWQETVANLQENMNQMNLENSTLKEQIALQKNTIQSLMDNQVKIEQTRKTNKSVRVPTLKKMNTEPIVGMNETQSVSSKKIMLSEHKPYYDPQFSSLAQPIFFDNDLDVEKIEETPLKYDDDDNTNDKEQTHHKQNSSIQIHVNTRQEKCKTLIHKSDIIDDYCETPQNTSFSTSTQTASISITPRKTQDFTEMCERNTVDLYESERFNIPNTYDPTIGNTPFSLRQNRRQSRLHNISASFSDGSPLSRSGNQDDDQVTPLRLIRIPYNRSNGTHHNELYISPHSRRRSRSIINQNSSLPKSFESPTLLRKKSISKNVEPIPIENPNTGVPSTPVVKSLLSSHDENKNSYLEQEMNNLKIRSADLEKREIDLEQRENEVLVVQIETENREEELQAWESDLERREEIHAEKEGELRRLEAEITAREEILNTVEKKHEHKDSKSQSEISKDQIITERATEPGPTITPDLDRETLVREKMLLEQSLEDQQLRVWSLEEQNKRVTAIVKVMDGSDLSETDIIDFLEAIKEIVQRKKPKLRTIITQKIVEYFGRANTNLVVTPRWVNEKTKKKSLSYLPFGIDVQSKASDELGNSNQFKEYRRLCSEFFEKENEYGRILSEFYEVYIRNTEWGEYSNFAEEFKKEFEPILILTKRIVDDIDRAYSEPFVDSDGCNCIALGSILNNYISIFRVYLQYTLDCPIFVQEFPVFSQSKQLTDSLVIGITEYINTQRLNDSSFVINSLLPLSTYIVTPISHFSGYPQVLRELAMSVSPSHIDAPNIKNALRVLESLEDEIDQQKSILEGKESMKYIQTLFNKPQLILDDNRYLVYFGMLRLIDPDKAKIHEDSIRVCFLFNNLFIITKVKSFNGKVLDKKSLSAKFYQELHGVDLSLLQGFFLDETDRCHFIDSANVSLIADLNGIKNGFCVVFADKTYHFSASSYDQQYVWATTLTSL
ncbi:DH domain-containing protein [Entamoeba marina]